MATFRREYFDPKLNELAMDVAQLCRMKGFEQTTERNIHQKLLLAVGEIIEAQEELRSGHNFHEVYFDTDPGNPAPANPKPEGFGIEIADCIIRLLTVCYDLNIDIAELINLKSQYNATRPYQHGRKF